MKNVNSLAACWVDWIYKVMCNSWIRCLTLCDFPFSVVYFLVYMSVFCVWSSVVVHLFLPVATPALCSRQTSCLSCVHYVSTCVFPCGSIVSIKVSEFVLALQGHRPLSESLLDLWTLPWPLYMPVEPVCSLLLVVYLHTIWQCHCVANVKPLFKNAWELSQTAEMALSNKEREKCIQCIGFKYV